MIDLHIRIFVWICGWIRWLWSLVNTSKYCKFIAQTIMSSCSIFSPASREQKELQILTQPLIGECKKVKILSKGGLSAEHLWQGSKWEIVQKTSSRRYFIRNKKIGWEWIKTRWRKSIAWRKYLGIRTDVDGGGFAYIIGSYCCRR